MLSRELGYLIKLICGMDRDRYAIWCGLNTKDGYFGLTVHRKPYRDGDVPLVYLANMELTLANVCVATRKLLEAGAQREDAAVQTRLDLGPAKRPDPAARKE